MADNTAPVPDPEPQRRERELLLTRFDRPEFGRLPSPVFTEPGDVSVRDELTAPGRARDRLLAYLRQAGLSTPRAEANIDAFAHELAEQVLALRSTVPDLKARKLFRDGYDAALMVAAVTIDPEAQR